MTTWVLVADASRARLLCSEKAKLPLIELEGFVHPQSRLKNSELLSSSPGSSKDAGGEGRHGVESPSAKQHEFEVFARQLCERINRADKDNEFNRLCLVCSPQFLGQIRQFLDEQVRQKVTVEVDKNLVGHTVKDIRAHLPELI